MAINVTIGRLRLGATSGFLSTAEAEIDKLLADQNTIVRYFKSSENAATIKLRLMLSLANIDSTTVTELWGPIIKNAFEGQEVSSNVVTGKSYPAQFLELALRLEAMHVEQCMRSFLTAPVLNDASSEFPVAPQFTKWAMPRMPFTAVYSVKTSLPKFKQAIEDATARGGKNIRLQAAHCIDYITFAQAHFGHYSYYKFGNPLFAAQNILKSTTPDGTPLPEVENKIQTDLRSFDVEEFIRRLSTAYNFARVSLPPAVQEDVDIKVLLKNVEIILSKAQITFEDTAALKPSSGSSVVSTILKYGPDVVAAVINRNPGEGIKLLLQAMADIMMADAPEAAFFADVVESYTGSAPLYRVRHVVDKLATSPSTDVSLRDFSEVASLQQLADEAEVQGFLPSLMGVVPAVSKVFGKIKGIFGSRSKKKKKKRKAKALAAALAAQQAQQAQQTTSQPTSQVMMGTPPPLSPSPYQDQNPGYGAYVERTGTDGLDREVGYNDDLTNPREDEYLGAEDNVSEEERYLDGE